MNKVGRCPLCDSNQLTVLDEMKVIYPENITLEKIRQDQATYSQEERWIFFEKIWSEPVPAILDVTLCYACGFIFTNPRFTTEEIRIIYQTVSDLGLPKIRRARKPFQNVEQRAGRIYSLISKILKHRQPPLKILDYGGLHGLNLVPFAQAGYDCNLLDFVKVEKPPNIKYLGRDVFDLNPQDRFDVIMILHVLEHTIEPLDTLQHLVPFLANDGVLYVEVPKGCLGEWWGYDEPTTHMNFFSEESCFKLVRMTGLDIVHLSNKKQWLYWRAEPCINIVGRKQDGYSVNSFRSTQQDLPFAPNWCRDLRKTPLKTTKRIFQQALGPHS